MTPELQAFANANPGFAQFDQRYQQETTRPDLRDEYVDWVLDAMREEGIRESGWIDGHAEGRVEGRVEGHAEGHVKGTTNGLNISIETVRLLKEGCTAEDVAVRLSVPISFVNELKMLTN